MTLDFDLPPPKKKKFEPPTLEMVREYFEYKKRPDLAEEFFEHFTNCRWKLSSGRGATMVDWTLAANKWIRDAWKFQPKGIPQARQDEDTARREVIRRQQRNEAKQREEEQKGPVGKIDPVDLLKETAPEIANYILRGREKDNGNRSAG